MGGLAKLMPYTRWTFLIGSLALAGIPLFAGFWSKDAIISSALAYGGALGWILYIGGLLGAMLTGLYTFRLYFRVFHGEPSELVTAHTHGEHSGEGARSMLLPVGVLALGATFVGFLAIPGVWEPFEKWLEPVVPPLVQATAAQDWFSSLISVALAVARHLPRLARVPGAARARSRRLRAHRAGAQALVRRALRRRRLAAGAGRRDAPA